MSVLVQLRSPALLLLKNVHSFFSFDFEFFYTHSFHPRMVQLFTRSFHIGTTPVIAQCVIFKFVSLSSFENQFSFFLTPEIVFRPQTGHFSSVVNNLTNFIQSHRCQPSGAKLSCAAIHMRPNSNSGSDHASFYLEPPEKEVILSFAMAICIHFHFFNKRHHPSVVLYRNVLSHANASVLVGPRSPALPVPKNVHSLFSFDFDFFFILRRSFVERQMFFPV